MKNITSFLPLLLLIGLVTRMAAQQNRVDTLSYNSEYQIVQGLTKILGKERMQFTDDVRRASVYLSIDPESAELVLLSNLVIPDLPGSYRGRLCTRHIHSRDIAALLGIRDTVVDVFRTQLFLPFYARNDCFFPGTLDSFKNITVYSITNNLYTAQRSRLEIEPGIWTETWSKPDEYHGALQEDYPADATSAVSLINNREINARLEKTFPDFTAIRTVDQLNRIVEKSREKTVVLFAQVEGDYLVRYTSDGSVSYKVPLTQFHTSAKAAEKTLFVVGLNFADNKNLQAPKGAVNLSEELELLEKALSEKKWNAVLRQWSRQGRDSVLVSPVSNPEFPCHNAAVRRWAGDSVVQTYNLVFFETPFPKPQWLKDTIQVLDYSGWIVLGLLVLQLLLFWKGRHPGIQFFKWLNLVVLIVFAFIFAIYFLMFR